MTTTTDELDTLLTDAAITALQAALASGRAHAAGTKLADAIENLTECKLLVSAARKQVTVELFAPSEDGGTLRLFAFTAEQAVLQ